jgi:hypothetical protein
MASNQRFLVYADFLGTTARYRTPDLILRGRQLLEQALVQRIVPRLEAHDMYLYVFSDTALITCPEFVPLLEPIASLFAGFLELLGNRDDILLSLWLRAAISWGEVIYQDHLHNGRRVRTIPILDTSLPKAYRLESLRKGSRIFIDPGIPLVTFPEYGDMFLKWEQITGRGEHVPNIGEFLWPAMVYRDDSTRLAQVSQTLHRWWSEALRAGSWEREDYYERMLQLDETVKLFIRAASKSLPHDTRRELLLSLLPASGMELRNVKYEWGVWFQAMKGLIESLSEDNPDNEQVFFAFERMKTILEDAVYWEHFTQELNYPDYSDFKRKLAAFGLHPSAP